MKNLADRQGDDDFAAPAEERVDFSGGVGAEIEGDEEALLRSSRIMTPSKLPMSGRFTLSF
ncbi:MAG: hypothetical protein BroJett003_19360 [Planctomycetota bacterium]|nr:MAG: hypothetical protein BroJett003_19360 [Planctomycetota bacterium]